MVQILPLETFFWYANLVLKVILLWRLASLGLAPRYKALCFVMALASLRTLALLPLKVTTLAYAKVYLFSQPLLLLAYALVALEIYGQVFESYRGISFLGRGFLIGAFVLSIAGSLGFHMAEVDVNSGPQRLLRLYLAGESAMYVTLLLFLLALAAFLLWYPIPLRKNLLHYNLIFLVFFAAMSAGIILGNPEPGSMAARVGSTLRMGIDTACLASWVFLFRRSWEQETSGVSFAVTHSHQVQVLAQLESMNQAILRVRKSS
ncbi:hypothetical protein [uncultured Paludibaculum sp.]|uniref:hypothetical protein n=1 Tax=uncultured Paludibaculum sp. TaxID=1765020 RepID=UPI002AAAECA7|nr:hypothetical protein [uncultured Paludibaculum sp.]